MNLLFKMYKVISKNLFLLLLTVFVSCGKDELEKDLNYVSDNQYFNDGEVEIIFENDRNNGINVIFLGDLYFQNNLEKEKGKYREHGLSNINYLFNTPPFSEYKQYFNAYIIYAESKTSKSDDGTFEVETPFGGNITNNGNLYIENSNSIYNYIDILNLRQTHENNLVLLSINGKNAESNGFAFSGDNLAVFGDGNNKIMIHEVGHAFADLGDEYTNEDYPSYALGSYTANLDSIDNLDLIKWKHFIGLDDYEQVGAYEGGNYRNTGFWRPELTSIMHNLNIENNFNAPSREAIVKRIFELQNLEYSFEDFLNLDKITINSSKKMNAKTNIKNFKTIECGSIHFLN